MQNRIVVYISLLTIFSGIVYFGIKLIPVNEYSNTTETTAKVEVANFEKTEKIVTTFDDTDTLEATVSSNSAQNQYLVTEDTVNELGEKLSRLFQLKESIELSNEKFNSLIVNYDQNLGNEAAKQELSSALLSSKEYRSNLMEKFKIERAIREAN